jgi:hypothetical protein
MAHADLDAGLERERVAARAVAQEPRHIAERADQPLVALAGQLGVRGQHAGRREPHRAHLVAAEHAPARLRGEWVGSIGAPFA